MSREQAAFPFTEDCRAGVSHKGMTLRQYAAIKLRVADSGEQWLDDMIRQSNQNDLDIGMHMMASPEQEGE